MSGHGIWMKKLRCQVDSEWIIRLALVDLLLPAVTNILLLQALQ